MKDEEFNAEIEAVRRVIDQALSVSDGVYQAAWMQEALVKAVLLLAEVVQGKGGAER